MLVEINFIQKKDKRSFTRIIFIMLVLCIVLAGATFLGLKYRALQHELSNVEQSLFIAKKSVEIEEKKLQTENVNQNTEALENAVKWAREYPISTVFMMRQLTYLLPARGFMMSFDYQDDGTVTISAQFDSSREVAFYLNHLTDSTFIKEATLQEINTVILGDQQTSTVYFEPINPRYNASFLIQLNKAELKAAEQEGEID